MKRVLLMFLGLVLLSQVVKVCEQRHASACVKRAVPARTHPAHPSHGGGKDSEPAIMIT